MTPGVTARRTLVVNAGSSSVKLAVLDGAETLLAEAAVPANRGKAEPGALGRFIREHGEGVTAVGHRVVHGGPRFRAPVVVDDDVLGALRELTPLAPLHQPPALEAIVAAREMLPDTPHVACFDTAFHADMPAAVTTYPVPPEWRNELGVRRYGFHGLSHAYASARTAEMVGRPSSDLRTVVCHLGSGASLCAVRAGRSVDTTMGFTPLEGLVMSTRSGTVDPGILLWLIESRGVSPAELRDALERRSGLFGLAGAADFRTVEERADAGDADATLALDVYVTRLCAGIAAMVATLEGLDALVFTGGIGERSATLRAHTAARLRFLGVSLDRTLNGSADGDADIGSDCAPVRTLVIHAREDIEIARGVDRVLA